MDNIATRWDQLLMEIASYLSPEDCDRVTIAYHFASQAHEKQCRISGEPYIHHLLATSLFLAEMRMDADALCAGLLHDVLEDVHHIALPRLAQEFGGRVAQLVDGLTKLELVQPKPGIPGRSKEAAQLETLDKMLRAAAVDVRVILIKLADRLHNMHTLDSFDPDRKQNFARETLSVYVPLAARFGIWRLKTILEDLALQVLQPESYQEIIEVVSKCAEERARLIHSVRYLLEDHLAEIGIKSQVVDLPQHLFDIYSIMQHDRCSALEVPDRVLTALLVPRTLDCYTALSRVHALWKPVPGKFDDYIVSPKENLYRSLHTTVLGPGGGALGIRLRTHEMHDWSEWGIYAYWRSGESGRPRPGLEGVVAWLSGMAARRHEMTGPKEFVETVMADELTEHIHVFTPKGQDIQLPKRATALDFAYAIHTEVGHACRGVRLNGVLGQLNAMLENGALVEIITIPRREPRYEWLDPCLGYLAMAQTRAAIRKWFRRLPRNEQITRGKALLRREFEMFGLPPGDWKKAALLLGFNASSESIDDFLAAVGVADVELHDILRAMLAQERRLGSQIDSPTDLNGPGILRGAGNFLTRLGKCCNPDPGHAVVGRVTTHGLLTVHRVDCPYILAAGDDTLLVELKWDERVLRSAPVSIELIAYDRGGLLRDFTEIVSREGVSIETMQAAVDQNNHIAVIHTVLDIQDTEQLIRIIHVVSRLANVRSIRRVPA